MPRRPLPLLLAATILSLASPLAAQESPDAVSPDSTERETLVLAPPALVPLPEGEGGPGPAPSPFGFEPRLDYRIWGDAFDMADFGEPGAGSRGDDGMHGAVYQRLRAGGVLTLATPDAGDFEGVIDLDLLGGRLGGDPIFAVPAHLDTGTLAIDSLGASRRTFVDPRELYLGWMSPVGQLRVGLQTSHWGLGLLANGGATANERLFNQSFGGDRVLRAIFATAPLRAASSNHLAHNLYVAFGADMVYRDENASFDDGDRGYQGVASMIFRDAQTTVGVYGAVRGQEDRNGDALDVLALDAHAEHQWMSDDARWAFRMAGELAYMTGSTTRSYAPVAYRDPDAASAADPDAAIGAIGLKALGAAAELEARHRPTHLAVRLLVGYASGDANTNDDTMYRFRFDPNYKVGLVMFDHYLPAVSRAAYARISDPGRSGAPPYGSEGLIETGSVHNALYLNPQLLVGDPDGLLGGVGAVWARSAVPITDPYASFARGGSPVGIRGATKVSHDLGLELDVAARYRHRLRSDLVLEVGAEYGIFFPGAAFDDVLGESDAAQNVIRGRLAIFWN